MRVPRHRGKLFPPCSNQQRPKGYLPSHLPPRVTLLPDASSLLPAVTLSLGAYHQGLLISSRGLLLFSRTRHLGLLRLLRFWLLAHC